VTKEETLWQIWLLLQVGRSVFSFCSIPLVFVVVFVVVVVVVVNP